MAMVAKASGETFQERSKGKDVRTSNVIAAKVSSIEFRHDSIAEVGAKP